MLFHTAGIEVSPWIPPLVAFIITFITSMGGVSGAFLLLPFQISFLGYTNPSVSATNHVFNIFAIPSGVYRYCKEGRMVWPLAWMVMCGTLPGVFIGAVVRVVWLPDAGNFKLFAATVLLYIGGKMGKDLINTGTGQKRRSPRNNGPLPLVKGIRLSPKRLRYTFDGDTYDVPLWAVFFLSFTVGIVGGIYGIGGGSIIAPFFVTFFGLPVYTVAGAALMGTFVTSLAAVFFYHIIAPFYPETAVAPDWPLGLLFGLGGMAGMYLGARCQKHIPARVIKWMLTVIILIIAARYGIAFFN